MREVRLKDPGLVENAQDGMSCLLACIQMAMRTHNGGQVYSFDHINKVMNRKPGKYSWEYGILSDLAQNGYYIEIYNLFDVAAFVEKGADYLIQFYGPVNGQDQIIHSDLPQVVEDARTYLKMSSITRHLKVPRADDLKEAIDRGYYAIVAINSQMLQGRDGIDSHVVFVYGYSSRGIIYHNPGFPSTCASEMPWSVLERVWNRPTEETREMYIIKPPSV
jgi:hypothetical protein